MNFIFPMAGLSSRFTDVGYTVPKYQLELHGATVFEYAVIGFNRYFADHNFVFAYRGGDEIANFITDKCLAMGIPEANLKLVQLTEVTSGQAETVRLAIDRLQVPENEEIVIFNIDTFQSDFVLPEICESEKVDGYLEVFIAEGEHWSFVEPGEENRVLRVAEKDRISEYCSSGLYHFRRCSDFCKAYDNSLSSDTTNLQGGERYVAPLYNSLLAKGADIRFHLISSKKVAFCGTPVEYQGLLEEAKFFMTNKIQNRTYNPNID